LTAVQAPFGRVDQGGWSNQSVEYGRSFSPIYDQVFPRDDTALSAASFLHRLATSMVDGPGVPRASACEFGVGTGRVALPLSQLGVPVTGVDSSAELLARVDTSADLITALGDIRRWRAAQPVTLSYCICATLSMLESTSEQTEALRRMAESTCPGGHVVVETHSPERVRRAHGDRRVIDFDSPVGGLGRTLRSRSTLTEDGSAWHLQHRWGDAPDEQATEFSRLLEPAHLVQLARNVGLIPTGLFSGWSGQPIDPLSPTYTAVFQVPGVRPSPAGVTGSESAP
jgi:2-polyprenyl-3-methyl-5-hydroxy-6-metoxy-1,4-benzoquinol methylase